MQALESSKCSWEPPYYALMQTIGDRIRQRRKAVGLTQVMLAKNAGVSQSAITHLESGRNENSKYLPQIAEALNVEYNWLLSGKGDADQVSNISPLAVTLIPLISWVQAGSWGEAVDTFEKGDAEQWLAAPLGVPEKTIALRVSGDSMTSPHPGPSYPDGVILYVDTRPGADYNGKRVIVKVDGEVTFKEFRTDGARDYLKPLNPQYPTIDITGVDYRIVGVVIATYTPE